MYRSESVDLDHGYHNHKGYDKHDYEETTCWSKAGVSILRSFRLFCKETSMHGFTHVATNRRHWFERLLWLGITAAAIWGAVDVSLGQWKRFNENPTVITLDKDFRSWMFPLPGVTECHDNKVDPTKIPAVIKAYWDLDPADEKYNYYKTFVETVVNSQLYRTEVFQKYAEDKTVDVDLFQLSVDAMAAFGIKNTWVDGATPKWYPVMTENGICFSTNTLAIYDISLTKPDKNDTQDLPLQCEFVSFSCFFILEMTRNVSVYVHSPYDVVDPSYTPNHIYLTMNRRSEQRVTESRCGEGVKELVVRRRRCLYVDEPTGSGKRVYSYNMCRRSCRNRFAVEKCGCKPFYNFYEEGTPCGPAGMACLSQYVTQLARLKCACTLQCNDAVYQELTYEEQFWEKGPFAAAAIAKYIVHAPRARYTREIVFHFQDLIVSFGGAAGLFLGASFLSFVEVFYFLSERFFVCCVRGKKANEQQSLMEGQATRPRRLNYEEERIKELTTILEHPKLYDRAEVSRIL